VFCLRIHAIRCILGLNQGFVEKKQLYKHVHDVFERMSTARNRCGTAGRETEITARIYKGMGKISTENDPWWIGEGELIEVEVELESTTRDRGRVSRKNNPFEYPGRVFIGLKNPWFVTVVTACFVGSVHNFSVFSVRTHSAGLADFDVNH
jgi:hypothetical protein